MPPCICSECCCARALLVLPAKTMFRALSAAGNTFAQQRQWRKHICVVRFLAVTVLTLVVVAGGLIASMSWPGTGSFCGSDPVLPMVAEVTDPDGRLTLSIAWAVTLVAIITVWSGLQACWGMGCGGRLNLASPAFFRWACARLLVFHSIVIGLVVPWCAQLLYGPMDVVTFKLVSNNTAVEAAVTSFNPAWHDDTTFG